LLEIEDLHAFYGRSHVVQGVSLRVEAGEGVGLVGHNGVGKTTTLKAIMGMGPRTAGRIAFAGRELRGPAHRRARLGLGFVPDAEAVFADMTVEENIRAAAMVHRNGDQQACLDAAYELFPMLGARRRQFAGTLSGGEQKALTLARGLALKPRLILVDEPSEGLMPRNVDVVAEALHKAIEQGIGVLVVDASFQLLKTVCRRLYVMKQGRITGAYGLDEFPTADGLVAAYLTGGEG
jgi:ABC-type branched-subunit amino acid transport system ATPase component